MNLGLCLRACFSVSRTWNKFRVWTNWRIRGKERVRGFHGTRVRVAESPRGYSGYQRNFSVLVE